MKCPAIIIYVTCIFLVQSVFLDRKESKDSEEELKKNLPVIVVECIYLFILVLFFLLCKFYLYILPFHNKDTVKKGSKMEFCVCIDRKNIMIETNTTIRF